MVSNVFAIYSQSNIQSFPIFVYSGFQPLQLSYRFYLLFRTKLSFIATLTFVDFLGFSLIVPMDLFIAFNKYIILTVAILKRTQVENVLKNSGWFGPEKRPRVLLGVELKAQNTASQTYCLIFFPHSFIFLFTIVLRQLCLLDLLHHHLHHHHHHFIHTCFFTIKL